VTDEINGVRNEHLTPSAAITKPFVGAARGDVGDVLGQGSGDGGGILGGVDDLRIELQRAGGGSPSAGPLDDARDGARSVSDADFVELESDAVVELYEEAANGRRVGAQLR
jgi:hypothetical protein